MKPPIVFEPDPRNPASKLDQPDDFTEVLDSIGFLLKQSGMSWGHERVVALVNNLHAAAEYIPANYQCAGLALSYQQLKAIENKLELSLKEEDHVRQSKKTSRGNSSAIAGLN